MGDLVGERDGALGGRPDLDDVGFDRLRILCLGRDQLAVVDDHREQVAEIVAERPILVRLIRAAVYSRFTSRQVFTSPSRWYPSSSSTLRAMARPRPASLVGAGIALGS